MKRILLLSSLLASPIGFCALPIDGWYAEVYGGYSYLPNNIDVAVNTFDWNHVNYASGYHGGGRFGYKNNPLRYEGDIAYTSATPNKVRVNNAPQTGVSGQTYAVTAMVNAYYDFPEMIDTLSPFIGLGIGYAFVNAHVFGAGPLMATEFRGSNSAFAYQGITGIAYHFADNYSIDLAYRYLSTTNITQLGSRFQTHNASAGVTYRFDGSLYQ